MPSDFFWPSVLTHLLEGKDLSLEQAREAMAAVMAGAATDSQLAAFLVALRAKPESVEEIVGFRGAILDNAVPLSIDPMVLDIVGTGGDPLWRCGERFLYRVDCGGGGGGSGGKTWKPCGKLQFWRERRVEPVGGSTLI